MGKEGEEEVHWQRESETERKWLFSDQYYLEREKERAGERE